MKTTLSLFIICLIFTPLLRSQEIANETFFQDPSFLVPDSAKVDSLPTVPKHSLLPANMSLMERGLWGERGILRGIGIASSLTPETRKSELSLRRTMLTMHQIGGFITLGLMATTVYYGQRTLDNYYNYSSFRNFRRTHQTLVTASIISYSATGLLAILSPPPFIRRDEVSTTTIHKTLAWVHFLGMVVTPIIGASLRHSTNELQLARYHQIAGYVTTAALAASMIIITF
jgi:hypothetical protein